MHTCVCVCVCVCVLYIYIYRQESCDKPRQCVKSRDSILPTKVCIVKAMVFPVVTYSCENWTIKKAEH